ncbi:hypothetical protein QBC35DRAFT_452091 [Podospora australis]|uniref:Uncharacterized protein n=1 Tax=Podospora australis TaxID=1536484 RepID=A0AAN7AIC0_9PEZI|nr:hypothetical protein QBC35DRAFT_452091 [Podospora australis]
MSRQASESTCSSDSDDSGYWSEQDESDCSTYGDAEFTISASSTTSFHDRKEPPAVPPTTPILRGLDPDEVNSTDAFLTKDSVHLPPLYDSDTSIQLPESLASYDFDHLSDDSGYCSESVHGASPDSTREKTPLPPQSYSSYVPKGSPSPELSTSSTPEGLSDTPVTPTEPCEFSDFDHRWAAIPSSRLLARNIWDYQAYGPSEFLLEASLRVPREFIFPLAMPWSTDTEPEKEACWVEKTAREMMQGFLDTPNLSVDWCMKVLEWVSENWVVFPRVCFMGLEGDTYRYFTTGYMILVDYLECAVNTAMATISEQPSDGTPQGDEALLKVVRPWLEKVNSMMGQLWDSRRRVRKLAVVRLWEEVAARDAQKGQLGINAGIRLFKRARCSSAEDAPASPAKRLCRRLYCFRSSADSSDSE